MKTLIKIPVAETVTYEANLNSDELKAIRYLIEKEPFDSIKSLKERIEETIKKEIKLVEKDNSSTEVSGLDINYSKSIILTSFPRYLKNGESNSIFLSIKQEYEQ